MVLTTFLKTYEFSNNEINFYHKKFKSTHFLNSSENIERFTISHKKVHNYLVALEVKIQDAMFQDEFFLDVLTSDL